MPFDRPYVFHSDIENLLKQSEMMGDDLFTEDKRNLGSVAQDGAVTGTGKVRKSKTKRPPKVIANQTTEVRTDDNGKKIIGYQPRKEIEKKRKEEASGFFANFKK